MQDSVAELSENVNSGIFRYMSQDSIEQPKNSNAITHHFTKFNSNGYYRLQLIRLDGFVSILKSNMSIENDISICEYQNKDTFFVLAFNYKSIDLPKRKYSIDVDLYKSPEFKNKIFELSALIVELIDDFIDIDNAFFAKLQEPKSMKYHIFINKNRFYIYFESMKIDAQMRASIVEYLSELVHHKEYDYECEEIELAYCDTLKDEVIISIDELSAYMAVPIPGYGENPTFHYMTCMRTYTRGRSTRTKTNNIIRDAVKLIDDFHVETMSIYETQNTVISNIAEDKKRVRDDEDELSDDKVKLEEMIYKLDKDNLFVDILFLKNVISALYFDMNQKVTDSIWENILIMCAYNGQDESYKILAKWFSLEIEKDIEVFENKWDEIRKRPYLFDEKQANTNSAKRDIIFNLKLVNNKLFKSVMGNFVQNKLESFILGSLSTVVPDTLTGYFIGLMLVDNFVFCDDRWFCFASCPKIHNGRFTRYKWVEISETEIEGKINQHARLFLDYYYKISAKLNQQYQIDTALLGSLGYKKNKEKTPAMEILLDKTKKTSEYIEKLVRSYERGSQRAFYKSMMLHMRSMIQNTEFIKNLDKNPYVFGVGNGILALDERDANGKIEVKFIDRMHPYLISKYAETLYEPSMRIMHGMHEAIHNGTAELDEHVAQLLRIFKDVIIEPDAFDFIFTHWASAMDSSEKQNILMSICAPGENGKTACLIFLEHCFGSMYHVTTKAELLLKNITNANTPSSIMMQLNNKKIVTISEVRKGSVLDDMQIKKLLSQEKKNERELFGKQELITVNAPITVFHNYNFIVQATDHGFWRRFKVYKPKNTFRTEEFCDPSNPYIKLKDTRVIQDFPKDRKFMSAFLAIMIYYYERFRNEYDGDICKVKSETIERETREFRQSENDVENFIRTQIRKTEVTEVANILTMNNLVREFKSYLQKNPLNKNVIYRDEDLTADLIDSSIKNEFKTRKTVNKKFLLNYEIKSSELILAEGADEIEEIRRELANSD